MKNMCWGGGNPTTSNNLKALISIIVVSHHIMQGIFHNNIIISSLGIFSVSLFFFISGYGLHESYITKLDYLYNFVKKKLMLLVLLFIIASAIYHVIIYIF